MSQELDFTPVETGDMSTIPPDAPPGQWVAGFKCTIRRTNKDGFPMVVIEAYLQEALTEGNEYAIGSKVADFLTFFPVGHRGFKMGVRRLHDWCGALKIAVPTLTRITTASDLQPLVDAIEENRAVIWTEHEKDKTTGEIRTKIAFAPPKGQFDRYAAAMAQESAEDHNAAGGKKKRRSA